MAAPERSHGGFGPQKCNQRPVLPKYCRIQDVVTLPFPLTWLWRSSKYAVEEAFGAGDRRSNNGRPRPTAMDATQPKPTSTTDTPAPAGTTNSKPAPTHCPSDNTAQRAPNTSNSAAPPISTSHNLTTENRANVLNQTSTTPQVQSPLTPFRSYRNQKFEDGTAAIPDAIHELCKQIRGCKRHKSTLLPVRLDLRTHMPDHFLSSNGTMRSGSPLNEWFGDTRLFTREEWLYLKGKKLESSDGGN